MNSERVLRILLLAALPALAGCVQSVLDEPGDTAFGEANRQTMMAQVIDPDPIYEETLVTSGEHAADAVERYRTDKVKEPDSIRTTNVGSEGGPN